MPKTVAFLGPEGTYTDEACYLYAPEEHRIPFGSLGLVTNALEEGKVDEDSNPNGSSNNIAGIFNEKKNILGMMPHPERLIDPVLSGEDGSLLFTSLLKF